jgi:hypothetical protein
MMACSPFDWQLSLSYFVVAHFHYVIVGGILFALFSAFYYWYPKMTGPNAERASGQMAFLVVLDWLSPDLRCNAHSGSARDAAPDLYVRARPRLGHSEPHHFNWRVYPGNRNSHFGKAEIEGLALDRQVDTETREGE